MVNIFITFVIFILLVIPISMSYLMQTRTTSILTSPVTMYHLTSSIDIDGRTCHYVAHASAKVLPAWQVRLPFGYGYDLNPAQWSIKEHVLYDTRIDPAVAIFFTMAIVWIGYDIAAIPRSLLLWEPEHVWPQALMYTTLFETFRKQDRKSPLAKRQMHIFFLCVPGMTLWQFLPEYVFPMTSSLAFLLRTSSDLVLGGMGSMNLSLDLLNINWNGSSILIIPFWIQTVLCLAFVLNCWALLSAAKWGNLGSYKHGLMSNSLLLANGTKYPIAKIINSDLVLTRPPGRNTVQRGPAILVTFGKNMAARKARSEAKKQQASTGSGNGTAEPNIHHQYTDRLNVLQRSYKEVPGWWFVALFLTGCVILLAIVSSGQLFISWWTVIVGVATGFIVVVPLGYLYDISNYQVATGDFNELIYGYLVHIAGGAAHHHPCGPSVYGSIAGDAWYRAQYMLQDRHIGHYMYIPSRTVFFSQVFGSNLGIPIDYGVIRWVLNTNGQYAVIVPKRMFVASELRILPYGFLVDAAEPLAMYALYRVFPKSKLKFHLLNTIIFFSGLTVFYGNLSTGYFSSWLGGFIAMY
ncbi:OPT superfamily oligopeptide transporter [Macroventuria anomochaeta]|uniref:OPT superfamily oligopeptide transporter n=1 Tax=Macroventuria anomochaeta TaxID=301207 RepID=A0ACB6S7Y6_9PLEO|nr:OPT superfamily oligopeptide transporter [Macroventuria anomochaeta]KAF2630169.1 OPT superfamily oligopeptide transporter [Macroventuria anomochaeta]